MLIIQLIDEKFNKLNINYLDIKIEDICFDKYKTKENTKNNKNKKFINRLIKYIHFNQKNTIIF